MSKDRKELEEEREIKMLLIWGMAVLLGQGIGYLLKWWFPNISGLHEIAGVAGVCIGFLFVDIKPLRIPKKIILFLGGTFVFGKIILIIKLWL